MNKELSSELSTKQLKKTKLLDNFKQQTTNRNKVMLTDLCAQQKAKIGDLVRTLQSRKQENIVLQKRIKQMQKLQLKYLGKIEQMQKIIFESGSKQLRLLQEIEQNKIRQQERQRYIEHILNEKGNVQREMNMKRNVVCVDQFALTDSVVCVSFGVQMNLKKKKCKQVSMQTQGQNMREQRNGVNNSRSFQKIMRGRVMSDEVQNRQKISLSRSVLNRKYEQIRINDEQNDEVDDGGQNRVIERSKLMRVDDQQDDQDFNQLAKKWLQLKSRNMSKIKQSYQKSRQKINRQSGVKNQGQYYNNIDLRQFNQGGGKNQQQQQFQQQLQQQVQQQLQQQINYSNIRNIQIKGNDSFGPKVNKRFFNGKQDLTEGIQQDFDDVQLNKILKSKNFSASRLLNKNNHINKEVQQRKTRKDSLRESKLNRSSMKLSNASNSRSNNIDFYETDLLDIVNSINRH